MLATAFLLKEVKDLVAFLNYGHLVVLNHYVTFELIS
jgi:hypothetical protein